MKNRKHFMELATKDNDGSTTDITADYSSASGSFQVKPAYAETISIERVIISIADATINDSSKYGGLASALTNGIRIYVKDGTGATLEELTGFPVKTNGEWAGHCFDFVLFDGFASGDDWLVIRWTFSKSGFPVVLDGQNGDYIEVIANDNFTGLANHRFFFQGHYKTEDLH